MAGPSSVPLIGLAGFKGSGKDTVGKLIKEWASAHGVHAATRAFADPLKLSIVRLFIPDTSLEEALVIADQLKSNGTLIMRNTFADPDGQQSIREHRISGRLALQRYGTESHRNVFGQDFWVDMLLPEEGWQQNFHNNFDFPPDIFVVTDVRLDNEAQRVKDLGGQIWRVKRPTDALITDGHSTEAQISNDFVDVVIENSYDLELLKQNVNNACNQNLESIRSSTSTQ